MSKQYMTFSEALEVVKRGRCIARESWNGKNMCVYMSPSKEVSFGDLDNHVACAIQLCTPMNIPYSQKVLINHHLDMVNAQGTIIVGWSASQTDMLAGDWYEVK